MTKYNFQLIDSKNPEPLTDKTILKKRPRSGIGFSFREDSRRFIAGEELDTAINTAIAVGEPLLLTGEPGTGKTQAAYYAAYMLNLEPVIHFQVKSDSTAKDLLYHFDAVQYFRDANIKKSAESLDIKTYVHRRALWEALKSDEPKVLLIDEIDKAPRDFPNDLLHELDKTEFTVTETGKKVEGSPENRPIVFITSNSERRLPEPFLRRCVYHHIPFDYDLVWQAVLKRHEEYPDLSSEFLEMAVDRFFRLRNSVNGKQPSTAELLVWLRILGLTRDIREDDLSEELSKLPYLGVLIKDHQDRNELR